MDSNEFGISLPNAADTQIEELFLGNILQAPERLKAILADVTLTPDSFFLPRNRAVYTQILELQDQGVIPELYQVQSRLNGECPEDYAHRLVSASYAVDLIAYAHRLVELASWRKRRDASLAMMDAVKHQDLEKYSRAKAVADQDEVDQSSFYSPKRLAEEFKKYLTEDGVEVFPLPFPKLNNALGGGLRRRQFTVLGGWTSHGKSILCDQILTAISKQGKKVHLYMNEMGHEERVARILCSATGISMSKLTSGTLTTGQKEIVNRALDHGLPFSITPCAGWSVEELTFDVRSKDFDVIGIDIIHQFDYDSESELARISRLLTRVAKQANCHVLATVHLNEFRANDVIKPRPVSRDIRGSGMLQRDPDNIMFVYRQQDPETGDPLTPTTIYLSKVRNGSLGYDNVYLNPSKMEFGYE